MTDATPPSDELKQRIERIFSELDPIQMAIFRKMTPAEMGRRVADMHAAMCKLALATERERHPDLPEAEIRKRAMGRVMRVSEWELGLRRKLGFDFWDNAP